MYTLSPNVAARLPIKIAKAAEHGKVGVVQTWLSGDGLVDATCVRSGVGGCTLLLIAAGRGHKQLIELLLKRGAEVNARDSEGNQALMAAAQEGHEQVADSLLRYGAAIELRNKYGRTALMAAARFGRENVVYAFLQHGAEVDLQDGLGTTALWYAAYSGLEGLADLLLRHGAEVNLQAFDGTTALACAAFYGHPAFMLRLLRAGADMTLRNVAGKTALQVAKEKGHTECVAAVRTYLSEVAAGRREAAAAEAGSAAASSGSESESGEAAVPDEIVDATGEGSEALLVEALQLAKKIGHRECIRVLEERAAAEAAAVAAAEMAAREAARAVAEVEASRHATALLAEIEAEEEAERRGKGKKGKKKKKKKGGEAGPSQEEAEEAAALAAVEEAKLAAAFEESTRLEDEARRGADEASGSVLQDAALPPEPAAGSEVPPELQCPLSFEVMSDPVMNVAGQTYERSAIEKWFAMGHRTDPMSGAVLESTFLVPNVLVRGMCRKHAAA